MKQQHHIIYVPGILDNIYHLQSLSVATWRLYGVRGHCHPIPWAGQEDYQPKIDRLVAEINGYLANGHRVSLVGASAGASAVLNVYALRPDKISSVGLICAKINRPESVSEAEYYLENPAFKTSLALVQISLPTLSVVSRRRIISCISPGDSVIPYEDTHVDGIAEILLPKLRHGIAILYCITFGAHKLLKQLKLLAI